MLSASLRWYSDFRLPENLVSGVETVRLHATDEDAGRKFNCPENVRQIPPGVDPDFEKLYRRRAAAPPFFRLPEAAVTRFTELHPNSRTRGHTRQSPIPGRFNRLASVVVGSRSDHGEAAAHRQRLSRDEPGVV